MRRVIRLTEKDLSRLIKRIISEQPTFDPNDLLGAEDTIDGSDPKKEREDDDEYYSQLIGAKDTIYGIDPEDEYNNDSDKEYYDQLLGAEDTIDGNDPNQEYEKLAENRKKVIKLSESDLMRIIKRVIKESNK